MTADRLVSMETLPDMSKLDEAEDWLRTTLADGPMEANHVLERARAAVIAERTLRRAKERLKVQSRQDGNSWAWVLP